MAALARQAGSGQVVAQQAAEVEAMVKAPTKDEEGVWAGQVRALLHEVGRVCPRDQGLND